MLASPKQTSNDNSIAEQLASALKSFGAAETTSEVPQEPAPTTPAASSSVAVPSTKPQKDTTEIAKSLMSSVQDLMGEGTSGAISVTQTNK